MKIFIVRGFYTKNWTDDNDESVYQTTDFVASFDREEAKAHAIQLRSAIGDQYNSIKVVTLEVAGNISVTHTVTNIEYIPVAGPPGPRGECCFGSYKMPLEPPYKVTCDVNDPQLDFTLVSAERPD